VPAAAGLGYAYGIQPDPRMEPVDPSAIARRLAELRVEHRDLDAAIARLSEMPVSDELQLKRLKKRKLLLKDLIARLQSRLIPDLDA
jgi:hypothetical protein